MLSDTQSSVPLMQRFPGLRRLRAGALRKVPFIPQHSNVECGVACLAMVLAYHGKHVEREELRSALGPTRDGVRAAHLLRTGRHFGLMARGFKGDLEALRHAARGSILHWQFNHYVVLQSVGRSHIDIIDPGKGPRRVSWKELDKCFTGVVLVFEPGSDFVCSDGRPKRNGLYANMLRAGNWTRIFSISFAAQLVTLALPMLIALIVDRVLPRSDKQLLYVIMVGLGLIVLFYWLSQVVRGHLLLHLRTLLDAKLTMQLVDRLLALRYTFFQQRSVGDLILRLESSKMVREVLTSGALTAVLDGTMMFLYLALLMAISPLLGAVVVGLGSFNVLVLVLMRGRRRAYHAEMLERQAASESFQFEMLNAIETIKGMGNEQRAVDRYCNLFVDQLNLQLNYGRLEILFSSLTSVLRLGAPLIIFTIGALEVLGGAMSVGTMLAVNTFAVGVFDPLSRLVEKLEQFERLGIYIDRMMDVFESPREQPWGKPQLHEPLSGMIELDDVSFKHGPLEPEVISQTSLCIAPGEFIGVVGPSGAGKSTLASLMLGLYQPTEGRILYDDRPLGEVDLTSLRAQIGVVTQNTQLFGGTIRSNIAMSDPELGQAEIERAARLANIHEDIMRMPAGYDTVLASSGSSISGGQRQRIALARALVRRPAILVLDEATSALDAASEAAIQTALESIRCTRIVIAHRLSTVARADRILVVERGRIVEQGAPVELLSRETAYARLVGQQIGHAALPVQYAPQEPSTETRAVLKQASAVIGRAVAQQAAVAAEHLAAQQAAVVVAARTVAEPVAVDRPAAAQVAATGQRPASERTTLEGFDAARFDGFATQPVQIVGQDEEGDIVFAAPDLVITGPRSSPVSLKETQPGGMFVKNVVPARKPDPSRPTAARPVQPRVATSVVTIVACQVIGASEAERPVDRSRPR